MMRKPLSERFWPKVEKGPECWLWTASRKGPYGQIMRSLGGRWRPDTAHRVAYELVVGPIPEGYEVDHLCRVKLCVRPSHLEAVPKTVNLDRQNERMERDPFTGRFLLTEAALQQSGWPMGEV
jgi:hypothetical protein